MGSGKNVKLFYFAQAYMRRLLPRKWLMWRRHRILHKLQTLPNYSALKERIDYYCHFNPTSLTSEDSQLISGEQYFENCAKVYLLDSEEIRRYFPSQLRWRMEPGDNTTAFQLPTITKSRPIGSCGNVLLKLNKVRHFIFLRDRKSWEEKKSIAIFRGRMGRQPRRLEFVKRFLNSSLVDAGCTDKHGDIPHECRRDKITLYAHFDYKFIVCLEGNDVASNLKWVMNSNSIAVMPKPRYETWFMEGRLKAGIHYIEIRDDFSDLEERLNWYLNHPQQAQAIIDAAHRWTAQFKNNKQERMISLAVMHNYMVRTGQLNEPEI